MLDVADWMLSEGERPTNCVHLLSGKEDLG